MPLSKENEVAHKAIGYAIEVHRAMGPGLEKEIYKTCLQHEMDSAGISYQKNVSTPLKYKGKELEQSFIIDYILENSVVVMLDSAETIPDYRIHTMVKVLQDKELKLGLIINFNYALMKNGIRRVTNHKMLEALGAREK